MHRCGVLQTSADRFKPIVSGSSPEPMHRSSLLADIDGGLVCRATSESSLCMHLKMTGKTSDGAVNRSPGIIKGAHAISMPKMSLGDPSIRA